MLLLLLGVVPCNGAPESYLHISLRGIVNPIRERHVIAALETARREGNRFVLLSLDTPGGLVTSMQGIIGAITNSQVPVVGFVEPRAAQATSAGGLILLACDIAAMAPGTRVGSAHPVGQGKALEPVLDEKATNSLEALARSLAERRGRPTELATDMVRHSKSFTASEARESRLVELVADDPRALLRQLEGHTLDFRGQRLTLHTAGLQERTLTLSSADRLLDVVAEPTLASLLLSLGLLGIAYEFASPGIGLGGIVGTVCLLLGLLGLSVLPVGIAGSMLLLAGLLAVTVEAKVPSHGLLAGTGVLAFVLGVIVLIEPHGYFGGRTDVAWWALAPLVASLVALILLFARVVRRAQQAPPQTGTDMMLGRRGTARTRFVRGQGAEYAGSVFVDGARWLAQSGEAIDAGDPIVVVNYLRQPSRLEVRPGKEEDR